MRVLVTGGAGYIGSVTSQLLLDQGMDVVVLDDLSAGHLESVPAKARFVEGNVSDPAALREAIAPGIDAVVHFAASIEVGLSMQHPEAFFSNNTASSLRMIELLVESGVDRVVFSSTAAVYGAPTEIPIREDAPVVPTSPYGESKASVERALTWMAVLGRLRYASLRYFNVAGSFGDVVERHDPETHLIPNVLSVAAGDRPAVEVFGDDYATPDGTCIRDFAHVADIAQAHVDALQKLDDRHEIVCNVGSGLGYSVSEVVERARVVTGMDIPIRHARRRPGDPSALVADIARAEELLGWTPRASSIDEVLASAWEGMRAERSRGGRS